MGFNIVSVFTLITSGYHSFLKACYRAFVAAHMVDITELSAIPQISLDQILGKVRPTIHMTIMSSENGRVPSDQAIAIIAILAKEQPKEVLEIGTFFGHTTRLIAENLPNGIIHTLDLPQEFNSKGDLKSIPKDDSHLIERRIVGREFIGSIYEKQIRQHFADTATWDFSEEGEPTFFFIDGSHTYEYCKNDSEKCFTLCKGRGVFLWHDCDFGHPGVVKFINEWRTMGRDIVRIEGTPIAYWKSF